MIFGYNLLGLNALFLYGQGVKRRKFAKTVYEGDAILDNVHAINVELSKAELESIPQVKQLWRDSETNYLSNYENKLKGGNIENENIPITHWILKRRVKGDSIYTPIGKFPVGTIRFDDWTAANDTEYEYSVHALSGTIESSETIRTGKMDFEGWNLINKDECFMFYINTESSEIQTNEDETINENYTKYPTVIKGKMQYESGSLTTMPMVYKDSQYESVLEDLNKIRDFINNDDIKLLKNPKGDIWWVKTSKFSHNYRGQFVQNPFVIRFDWIEVGDGRDPFVGGDLS